jgi:fumarate reductase subunit C
MKNASIYTAHHPRWYRERVSTYWWMWQWKYLKFILRELSSLAVAWLVLLTLMQVRALKGGPDSYAAFQHWLEKGWVVLLNAVSLVFVLFHTITWFNLSPRAMVVRIGGKRVPDAAIAAPNYAAWILISAFVAWMVMSPSGR